jgi:glycosyltransferase involved in cell wall biosynthesis
MRSRSLLQALKLLGHEVTMVSCVEEQEVRECPPELADLVQKVEFIRLSSGNTFDSYFGRLLAFVKGKAYGAWRFRDKRIQDAIAAEKSRQHFDAILCDDIYMFANVAADESLPVLLNKDDITFEIVEQYAQSARWPVSAYAKIEARRVRQFEVESCNRTHAILPCSERDRDAMLAAGVTAQLVVLPNVIDVARYDVAAKLEDPATLLYVGAMDWYPNIDGVRFFAAEILPLIVAEVPEVRFVVAGRNPSAELVAELTANKHIEFTGTVADVVPYLSSATVCVVPLRIGSGTRLKIIEAAATGKAVVSTVLGADGLTFKEGEEIVRADDPATFAKSVVSLLRDPARRASMGAAAKKRAAAEYSIAALSHTLHRCFSAIGIDVSESMTTSK